MTTTEISLEWAADLVIVLLHGDNLISDDILFSFSIESQNIMVLHKP